MNRPVWRRPSIIVAVLCVLLLVAVPLAVLRPPQLPGYRLEARPLFQFVVATGRVISTSRAQVGSEITGTVLERRVQEGDAVKPGDVLVVLRADDLQARVREAEAALRQLQGATRPQAAAALRQAEAQLQQAARESTRRATLFAQQLVAREALEQAQEAEAVARAATDSARLALQAVAAGSTEERQLRERLAAAQAQLARTTIRATVAGTVLTRNAEPGDLVQPGRVLFEIARQGVTEIEVPVDEKNLATLAVGQSAQCIADAWPAQPFAASVNYVAPGIDATRGTVTIRLRVDPPPAFLRQDMTVTVNVETGRRDAALVLPNDALLEDASGTAVHVVRGGRVRRVPVQLGLRGLTASEVSEGLAAGDEVLLSTGLPEDLREGMRVRVRSEALPATGAASATRRELPVNLN